MLSRYQTGSFVTVGFYLIMLLLFASGLYDAIWHHRWNGWLPAVFALLASFSFHKRFYER